MLLVDFRNCLVLFLALLASTCHALHAEDRVLNARYKPPVPIEVMKPSQGKPALRVEGRKGIAIQVGGESAPEIKYPLPSSILADGALSFFLRPSAPEHKGAISLPGLGIDLEIRESHLASAQSGSIYGKTNIQACCWRWVALVFHHGITEIYVDDELQFVLPAASVDSGPLTFKAKAGGAPLFVDEVTWLPGADFRMAFSAQPELGFKALVIGQLEKLNKEWNRNFFAQPNWNNTTIIRNYINSLVDARDYRFLPFYDINANTVQELVLGDYSHPGSNDASLYYQIQTRRTVVLCGGISLVLLETYRSMGYSASMVGLQHSWLADSHATVEVFLADAGKYVLQDPTYNLGGCDAAGQFWSIGDLIKSRKLLISRNVFPLVQNQILEPHNHISIGRITTTLSNDLGSDTLPRDYLGFYSSVIIANLPSNKDNPVFPKSLKTKRGLSKLAH